VAALSDFCLTRKLPMNQQPTFYIILFSALAALAGASVVLQQVLNANLRGALDSAAWSGFVSYLVGLICMMVFALAMRDPIPSATIASRIPWWAWSGGMFGAIFIGLAIILVPQLGAATFIALLISGQMLASIIFDHFGLFGLAQRTVDLPRLLGVVLLVVGVVLIRR
jgi:bacterial/archaeal transporter family-2 protein